MPCRFVALALAITALLTGMWIGLVRLGWAIPLPDVRLYVAHGPLMVCGFFGTVIGLERAIALRARWSYVAPLATAIGTTLLILGAPAALGASLVAIGSAVFVVATLAVLRVQPSLFNLVGAGAAAAWLVGTLLWAAGHPMFQLVGWWLAFLALTIAAERLELSRLLRPTPARSANFALATVLVLAGLVVSVREPVWGQRLLGIGFVALTAWLWHYDVARRTVRQHGLPRFVAVCLLSGYAWLGIAGALLVARAPVFAGPIYDAVLHAVFLGFAVSMMFGHAPIVFPTVLARPLVYHNRFYLHVAVLHASLLLRVAADLSGAMDVRKFAGLLNELAILGFLVNTVTSLRGTSQRPQPRTLQDAAATPGS